MRENNVNSHMFENRQHGSFTQHLHLDTERKTETMVHRDGHETSMAETETRPRRDVCRSRDVTETLKCTFIVTNAV